MNQPLARCIAALLLLSTTCLGQTASQATIPSYPLTKVQSSGSKRFAEADIVKATGLKVGSRVTGKDLKQAAERLTQSGVFAQVQFRFDAGTADYLTVDSDQFVPATFENFVWFTDANLVARIHSAVPLFSGSIPFAGNLAEQVSAALDAILKEKGISGHTTSVLQDPVAGQTQTMQFHIDGVTAKIVEIRFPGAKPAHLPLLQAATNSLLSQPFSRSNVPNQLKVARPVYGKLGFLKAQFGEPRVVLLKDDPAQPTVAVEISVQEGDQYTFLGTTWSGASKVPSTELAKVLESQPGALKPGDPADTTQVGRATAIVKALYSTKGYMLADVKSTATLDNEKHTAAFNVDVNEGPLYHMGKLDIQGLDPQRTALVRKVWTMRDGDVYDSSYVKDFIKKRNIALESLNGWNAPYLQTIHDDTATVDLALKFEKFEKEAR